MTDSMPFDAPFVLPAPTIAMPVLLNQLRAMQSPSPSEEAAILNHISEAEANLLLYDAEIARLEEATEKLKVERRNTQQIVGGCRSLLAPVRKLPTELLVSIFEACCTGDPDRHSNNVTNPGVLAPLNLGLVCHLWRDIAISTPQLWSTISLVFRDANRSSPDIVKLFLRRSEQLPLTVHVFDDQVSHEFSDDYGISMRTVRVLADEAHRFNYVHLDGYTGLIECLIAVYSETLLTRLSISLNSNAPTPVNSIIKIWRAPRLQFLELVNASVSQLDPGLAFHQITRLSIEPPDVSSTLQLVEKFKNVIEAVIIFKFVGSSSRLPMRSICASSLSSLTLDFTRSFRDNSNIFFESVTLPSLTTLNITSSMGYSEWWVPESLVAMLSRSQCLLEALTIKKCWIAESKDLFAAIPTLTYLAIEDSLFTAPLLRHLTYTRSSAEDGATLDTAEALLPQLKHISLKLRRSFNEWQLLVDMLESRRPPMAPYLSQTGATAPCLDQVSLCSGKAIDVEVKGRLVELQGRGLMVRLTGY